MTKNKPVISKNKTYLYAELTIRFSRVLMLNNGNYGYAMKTGLQ